jgi:hypothetical protein
MILMLELDLDEARARIVKLETRLAIREPVTPSS